MRISCSGEFVHLADWNIPEHGKENTSHGCINVAPAYIYWFYDPFNPGDVVDVVNTAASWVTDGLGDWTLNWADWVKGSATYSSDRWSAVGRAGRGCGSGDRLEFATLLRAGIRAWAAAFARTGIA